MSDEKVTVEQLKKMQAVLELAAKTYKENNWAEIKAERQRKKDLPAKYKIWETFKLMMKAFFGVIVIMVVCVIVFQKTDAEKATAYAKYSGADNRVVQTLDCSQTTLQITAVRNGKLVCTQPN